MNTHVIHWAPISKPSEVQQRRTVLSFYYFADLSLKYIAGAVSAFAVIIGTVMAVNDPGLVLYVQVAVFTAGLLFLGLALEAEKPVTTGLAVATALALPVLAYQSQYAAPEWLVVAAGPVAAWIFAGILQFDLTARR